ncbi:glycosyltransferase family 2 protein [Cryobacterium adonitolivorans]|uniref:Glycosyltransferase family 2 protein n=1 Tax=Cryobacterium adonitolivorans TaxID=1259189 RepID=A0A4R8W9W2_9MICO|nr:glycosyltransferase [Cryobacterium adonitolivorans]TFC05467.1 glycosyltransferase family 2 protein [Cryobacterium adonitolivorans]
MSSPIVLQKVVFPSSSEPDVAPLYVDPDEWTQIVTPGQPTGRKRRAAASDSTLQPLRLTHHNVTPMLAGRRGLKPGLDKRISLGTYFNAFPASYWRRWTRLAGVRLSISTTGPGDVIVYRSNARGVIQVVDSAHVEVAGTVEFDLGFDYFIDGGWYWFDLVSRGEDFALTSAEWQAPPTTEPAGPERTLTIAITTLNRTAYCLELLATVATDADVLAGLDQIIVVDQGTDKIRDHSRYAEVDAALGGRLRVIDQVNAGGSGGFSRGMLETVAAGDSDYVMLLDDDVVVEPESIRRALAFARQCTDPTIVGGHMFDMFDKTKLHAFAESIDSWNFMWGPITPSRHDFTAMNLRQTTWLHKRNDVAYNGWWMSLIPVEIIREIGLSLPVFIKWDDAEFSLRASEHGYSTVSLPGAAVWHVSWVDKDDSRDWQAFYHARNRLVAALLHSPHAKGGRLTISNLASDVRHLLTMDYYTVKLRQLAYESVMAGPDALHGELTTRLPAIRAIAADYPESGLIKDLSRFGRFPMTNLVGSDEPRPSGRKLYSFLIRNFVRHGIRKPHANAGVRPDTHLPRTAPWWTVPSLDSVVITNAEGSGVTWHIRDRGMFRSLLWSSLTQNLRFRRRWSSLSETYRSRKHDLTSMESWTDTLGLDARDAAGIAARNRE